MGRIHYFCAQKEGKSMELPIAIFSYRVNDLLEEVTKRTSYLGKMRGNENIPTMLDSLALTSGEDFLFNEFLEDAVSETYDWLKAFGRKIKHAVSCDIKYQEHKLFKNSGLKFTIDTKEANINEDIKLKTTFSVSEEATAELYPSSSSNKTWIKNYLKRYLSEEDANVLMNQGIILFLDDQDHNYIHSVTVQGIDRVFKVYRNRELDNGDLAWEGDGVVMYIETSSFSIGDEMWSDTADFTIIDIEEREYRLPMWNMYDNYIFQNEVEGVGLRIKDGDSLGKIDVRAGWASVSTQHTQEEVKCKVTIRYTIKSILEGYGETEETKIFASEYTLHGDDVDLNPSRLLEGFEWVEMGDKHTIQSVECRIAVTDVTPFDILDIKAGDYVEYHYDFNNLDAFKVYKVVKDCTNADWLANADLLASDYRENVTFVLERTSYFDDNMIGNVDRNIKEALVNYIIWRWFEYVNVPEADKFYLKFEDYAHKAQLGMNSETKPIQRKYKLF